MKRKSGFGIFELVIGILLIIMGVFTFIRPAIALNTLMSLFGILAIIQGITDIVMFVKIERYSGFGPAISLIAGILSVMAGVMLFLYPGAGIVAISIVFPIWFIAHSISQLAHIDELKIIAGRATYYITLILSILGLILGILMIFRPLISMISASYLIGIYMILIGINAVAIAISNFGRRF